MAFDRNQPASKKDGIGVGRLAFALILFAAGAVLLWLVMTGRIGSQEPYADGNLGPSGGAVTTPTAPEDDGPPEVRAALGDYSWRELSAISALVEAAPSPEEAQAIAISYHLLNEDGTVPDAVKSVRLSNGTVFNVRLADINHDMKSDWSGPAGLAFVSVDAVAIRPMNSQGGVEGGWEGSEIRSWLNGEFLDLLPSDLQGVLCPVIKMTNNVGSAWDTSAVTATGDTVYLLSAREVAGDIHWFEEEYGSGQAFWDSVVNAEGEQYRVFAQAGVSQKSDPNGVLVRSFNGTPTGWSYRTAFQYVFENIEGCYFYGAMDSGFPYAYAEPEAERGVVIGFCI